MKMNKSPFLVSLLSCATLSSAQTPSPASWRIVVEPEAVLGPIKPMNAVSGGPTAKFKGNQDDWRHARIPFGRTHDMNYDYTFGGPHTIDIAAVFPNFDADENDPKSYDFFYTDLTLEAMLKCGTEPFYRLGPSIESGDKRYHVHPPKDFAKWARVCEHIIRHCNEGWADGHRYGIRYWEIWCEPDLNPRLWTGTHEQFLDLYKTTAKHLKRSFPGLKIGGPGFADALAWRNEFLPFCRRENVPLDFYSWHCYLSDPRRAVRRAHEVRALLDANGFEKAESVYGEWNYVNGKWGGGEWRYARLVESGCHIQKGAAFAAAMMAACQDAPVDIAIYYDTRPHGGMNMLFDSINIRPMLGYYPFYAWGKLANDYGQRVKAQVAGDDQLYVIVARNPKGALAVWISRYSNDNNVLDDRNVRVELPSTFAARRISCHLTDDIHAYTEVTLDRDAKDGAILLKLAPNSFAFIEIVGPADI